MWQSNAPIPTTTLVLSPNRTAHSLLSFPAGLSEVYVSLNNREIKPANSGSNEEKKSSGGRPPNCAAHNALCPAEHTPRLIWLTFFSPVNRNGIQSQCSTQE